MEEREGGLGSGGPLPEWRKREATGMTVEAPRGWTKRDAGRVRGPFSFQGENMADFSFFRQLYKERRLFQVK